MLLNETTFTFLDVETTGLFPQFGDRICEIALLRWRNGKELGSFESLVRPGQPISPGAHAVNGITDEMVADAPHFRDVLPSVLNLTDDAVIVGHNIPFDLGFLANQMQELGTPPLRNQVVDTLALARMQYSFRRNGLKSILLSLGFSLKSYHRAMADVFATKFLFEYFLDDFEARGFETLEQLIYLQGRANLPPKPDRPPFGPGSKKP